MAQVLASNGMPSEPKSVSITRLMPSAQVLAGKGMQANQEALVDLFTDVLFHRWQLKSAYAVAAGREPEFTVYTDQAHTCRDYIWFSSENLNANTALEVRGPRVQG